MYIIGNVVYGVDLQSEWGKDPFKDVRDEINRLSNEEKGVTSLYHGGADAPPVYFGLELGEFAEIGTVDGGELSKMLNITDVQKLEYSKKLNQLQTDSPELYDVMKNIDPKPMVIWSSS